MRTGPCSSAPTPAFRPPLSGPRSPGPGAACLRPLRPPSAQLGQTRRRPLRQPAEGTLPAGAGRRSRSSLRPEAQADAWLRPPNSARLRDDFSQWTSSVARPSQLPLPSTRLSFLLETHPLGESQPQTPGGGTCAHARLLTHSQPFQSVLLPGTRSWHLQRDEALEAPCALTTVSRHKTKLRKSN